jgi:hypothetical protein
MPLIGLYGQSGSGKTHSALMLARGFVGPTGKIGMIDTESGRGEIFSDVLPGGYSVLPLDAPFSAERYQDAIRAANGLDAVIIDSVSHEWEGVGGVLDQASAIEERTGKAGLHCWNKPKMAHQKFMLTILQSKIPVICCLRAKYKSKQGKNPRTGKTEIIKDEHTSPIQDESFIYEMTIHAEILQDHTLRVTKLSHPGLRDIFKSGDMISIETGAALRRWSDGAVTTQPKPVNQDGEMTPGKLKEIAAKGSRELENALASLSETQMQKIKGAGLLATLKETATKADLSDDFPGTRRDVGGNEMTTLDAG